MMPKLLHLAICVALAAVVSSEFCKVRSSKFCFNYCCANGTTEYCCPHCYLSVRIERHPSCNHNSLTTTAPPRQTSWWDQNGWWVNLLLRVGLPVGFFLVGGIIIVILICTGKINVKRVFGQHQRSPAARGTAVQVMGVANQPPSYAQATGASYPVQPASATVGQTTTTTAAYPMQSTTAASGAYPVQPPPYTVPPGASYPTQPPFSVSYPPMTANPNYPPVQPTNK